MDAVQADNSTGGPPAPAGRSPHHWTAEALDALPSGVSICDEGGTILYTNAAEDRLFGYEPGELVGQHVSVQNSYSPEENERRVREVLEHLRARGEWHGQWRNRRKDGSVFYTDSRIKAIQVDGQRCWLCLQDAVGSRPRPDDPFQTLADSMANLAWIAHSDGHIFWYNQRWYEYTGATPEQMKGWGWTAVHHPDTLPAVMSQWTESIRTARPFEMVFPLRGADGRYRPFLTRSIPLFDPAGNVDRWFGTNTDISAQVDAEAALRQTEERLLRVVEASTGLLQSMSVAQVISETIEAAPRLLPCHAAAIWRENADHLWRIVASQGLSESYVASSQAVSGALSADTLMIVTDAAGPDGPPNRRHVYQSEGIGALLGVPLRIRGGLSGTLILYFREPRAFSRGEQEVARALGNVAAAALTSAEIFEREAETRRNAEAGQQRADFLARAGVTLHASHDIHAALSEVLRMAVPDIADHAVIELTGRPFPGRVAAGPEPPAAAGGHCLESTLRAARVQVGRILFYRAPARENWTTEDAAMLDEIARRVAIAVENTRLHREVREASERAHLAMEAAELGTWDFDLLSGRLTWSARTRSIFGVEFDTAVTSTLFYSRVHPEDRQRVRDSITSATSPGSDGSANVEYRVLLPDGTERWIVSAGRAIFEGEGLDRRAVRVIGIVRDNTSARLAEQERQALLAREQEARSAAELLNRVGPLLLSELDRDRLVQKLVELCSRLVGASEGVLSAEFESWKPTRIADCHAHPTFASRPPLGNASVRSLLAVPVTAHTGESFGTLVFGHPEPGRFGPQEEQLAVGIAAQAAIALDNARLFEEALHVQQALHRANLSLRSANTDLEQFAFAAAHDLREPLRMVTTYTQLLERRLGAELNEQNKSFMTQIVDGARRMSDLLQDLLSYTNTATQFEPAAAIDLHKVIETVLMNLGTAIAESGAEVRVGPLPVISGRSGHMVLVFQNLIANAIKYRRPDVRPVIDVSAGRTDGKWLFRVRDNGIGIAEQYQTQIFGVFKRLHGREIPGTGIGLAICQRAVERAGGKIWVESVPGEGSTFQFTLPAAPEPGTEPAEAPPPAET